MVRHAFRCSSYAGLRTGPQPDIRIFPVRMSHLGIHRADGEDRGTAQWRWLSHMLRCECQVPSMA